MLSVIEVDTPGGGDRSGQPQPFGNGSLDLHRVGRGGSRLPARRETGMIGVNVGVAAPVAFFPFSGWKDSFLGDLHAHGPDAVEFFTRKKTVTSRWFGGGDRAGPISWRAARTKGKAGRGMRSIRGTALLVFAMAAFTLGVVVAEADAAPGAGGAHASVVGGSTATIEAFPWLAYIEGNLDGDVSPSPAPAP